MWGLRTVLEYGERCLGALHFCRGVASARPATERVPGQVVISRLPTLAIQAFHRVWSRQQIGSV